MGEIILFILACIVIPTVLGYYVFGEMIEIEKAEEAEHEAFERHRQLRQAEFDRHAQAVAHRVIIETCENVYIGNWRGDNGH